jgi:hypothetical protein
VLPLVRIARAKARLHEAKTEKERKEAQAALAALLAAYPHWAAEAAREEAEDQSRRKRRSMGAVTVRTRRVRRRCLRGQQKKQVVAAARRTYHRKPLPGTFARILLRAYEERPRSWDAERVIAAVLSGWHRLRRVEKGLPLDEI